MDYNDLDRAQLLSHISEMNQELLKFQEMMKESDWLANCLKERTRILNERMKELDCVFKAVQIFRDLELTPEGKTRKIVESLPRAWRYPEFAGARAVIDGVEFKTENFNRTAVRQSALIRLRDHKTAELEVCYSNSLRKDNNPVFLPEEQNLIIVIAEVLGAVWDPQKIR